MLALTEMEATTMASNVYTNLTPAKALDKKTLNQMVWRSCNLQGSFNYERMQANGWLYSILPGLIAIHGEDSEDLKISMGHNLEFFNTHPFLVTFVMGIVLSLEQQKADPATISAVRIAAAGPLGGIGDAIFWMTMLPIAASIGAGMALNGSLLGPILFLIIYNAVQFGLRFGLMYWSYNMGSSAITTLTANAKEFSHAAAMLGVFVVGAMTCTFGNTKLGLVIPNGDAPVVLQNVLDSILPKILPLGLTIGMYFLMTKKGWTPVKCIVALLVLGLVGCLIGLF